MILCHWKPLVLAGALLGGAALQVLPVVSVEAYSGPQVVRDDSEGYPYAYGDPAPPWTTVTGTYTGWDEDYDFQWAPEGAYPNQNFYDWFPYPNPSPTYMCPFIHIADVDQSQDSVQYLSTPTGQATPDISQYQSKNMWVAGMPGNFTDSDLVQMYGDSGLSSVKMTADAVAFHYNDPSCTP